MANLATLQGWLLEAETARHKLVTGSNVERLQHGDSSMQFTPANLADLDNYIASLRAQIGGLEGDVRKTTRPIYLGF